MLTALSGMGVVMNGEAAWAVKPFPAAMTDVFPGLKIVVTIVGFSGTGRFRRGTPGFGVQIPSETCELRGVGYRRR